MGCFPEKTETRYQQFSPEKQRLIKKYYDSNPNDSSVYIPVIVRDNDHEHRPLNRKRSPRSSRRKTVASPTKNRKNYGGARKGFLSSDRKIDEY